jgi:hypothetical protein
MESIKNILKRELKKKEVAPRARHEFQEYGIWLSEQLHDKRHKALYIKLAKEKPRISLEKAMVFAIDYNTQSVNRGKLFMWKLQQLEQGKKGKQLPDKTRKY